MSKRAIVDRSESASSGSLRRASNRKSQRTHAGVLRLAALLSLLVLAGCTGTSGSLELTNVSYDPTRELYVEYNRLFTSYWEQKTGQKVSVIQSHGGSGKQALEVANGLDADVVTLALESDVDAVQEAGLIKAGYPSEFSDDSAPYTSSIVFLVRAGNPKHILDWNDLLRKGVSVITPNPKTSGGARWNYLAAWYYFEQQGEDEREIIRSMSTLYHHVAVLDSGARGSTTSFVENSQGDVLISWENEAFLSLKEHPGEYEIVYPSVSILCQPTVAIVDEVVDRRNSREMATAYLDYLYSKPAQRLEAENFYRPTDKTVFQEFKNKTDRKTIRTIPKDGKWIVTEGFRLTEISHFGGWKKATEKHFRDRGVFDSFYDT